MTRHAFKSEQGSTLVEAIVAVGVLSVGLLSLAQVFGLALKQASSASAGMIAREKAREAVESVHTARDTKLITWAQIHNVADGGIFTDAATPLRMPGPDGMMNTADDCTTVALPDCKYVLQSTISPGPDGRFGTSDDVKVPLADFTRQIKIEDVVGSPALRRLTVTITYKGQGGVPLSFTLVTYISSFA